MNLNYLDKLSKSFGTTPKMPVLFLGHGSPMNAIEENEFVNGFKKLASELPIPNAIICISAHWETDGTKVTAMENPETIHDFRGFPQELFDVKYPAPGHQLLAFTTKEIIKNTPVELDHAWGLDHGAWSVIKHLYPKANIPTIQLSINRRKDANFHFQLAKELAVLRERGVLIIGSGNMVHNLGKVAWNKINEEFSYDWAAEASSEMKDNILNNNTKKLINYRSQGEAFNLAIPTPEHYIPMLYTMGLFTKKDEIELFNDKAIAGSISMTSIKIF